MILPEHQVTVEMPELNGKKIIMVQTNKGEALVLVPSHWSQYTIKEYLKHRLESSEELLSFQDKLPVYDSAI